MAVRGAIRAMGLTARPLAGLTSRPLVGLKAPLAFALAPCGTAAGLHVRHMSSDSAAVLPKNIQTPSRPGKASTAAIEQVRLAQTLEEVNAVTVAFTASQSKHGHVAYIREALARIDDANMRADLQTYDLLLNVFPKENAFKTRNLLDAIWPKDSLQADTALNILERMEANYIIPERSTFASLLEVFGQGSAPIKKVRRMAYWMRRYLVQNPFAAPDVLPAAQVDIAKLALMRISGPNATIQAHTIGDDPSRFVLASHTNMQREILNNEALLKDAEILLQGPSYMWYLRERRPFFFATLASAPSMPAEEREKHGEVILGLMMAHATDKEMLVTWRRKLEDMFPGARNAQLRLLVLETETGGLVKEWSEPVGEPPVFKVVVRQNDK